MQGGAAGLQIELQEEGEDLEDYDEDTIEAMPEANKKQLNQHFLALYN